MRAVLARHGDREAVVIAWALRLLAGLIGVRVQKFEVTLARWPKESERCAGGRFLRLYVSALVLGRFMDLEVRL